MKKAFVLLLALAVLGGAVFADPAYTLTGSATLTWGYDLDTQAHGFTNAASAKLVFPLGAHKDAKTGEAITGEISISEFKVGIEATETNAAALTTTKGAVTAKILFPSNLYLQIASAPKFEINHAQQMATWVTKDFADAKKAAPAITSAGGFTFGMTGDFNFALKVGSTNTHTAAAAAAGTDTYALTTLSAPVVLTAASTTYYQTVVTGSVITVGAAYGAGTIPAGTLVFVRTAGTAAVAAPANDYLVGADVGVKLGDLGTLTANAIYGAFQATNPTLGLGLKATLAPIDGLAVVAAGDFQKIGTVSKFDGMLTVDYTMADMFKFGVGGYYYKQLEATANYLDARVRASLLAVENLTFEVGVDALDLLADPAPAQMSVLIGSKVAYKAMLDDANYLKPYVNYAYSLKSEGQYLNAGIEAMFFPLTTFTLDYVGGKITDNGVTIVPKLGDTTDKGIITFATKISY